MAAVALTCDTLEADDAELGRFATLLDDAERARAGRFRFARDRRRFVVRRARLRLRLAAHMGVVPHVLAFGENAYGKPALPNGPCFSLSHSGDYMMLAIAETEVGCDIEQIDDAIAWRPIADDLFAPAERNALAALPDGAGRQGFFDCWARKEAFVKAIGLGLSYPLDAFTVSVNPDARLLSGGEGWTMMAVSAGPGYAGALVVREDGAPLRIEMAR